MMEVAVSTVCAMFAVWIIVYASYKVWRRIMAEYIVEYCETTLDEAQSLKLREIVRVFRGLKYNLRIAALGKINGKAPAKREPINCCKNITTTRCE